MASNLQTCKACGTESNDKYCPRCGQSMAIGRLSLHHLLHEVFHLFTHVEKGFLYTLKMLISAPGKMQREYIEGSRVKHQKPFSMFFISATISALIYYWINSALMKYLDAGSAGEAQFFHQYWVLFHICMFPLYALITYLCFKKAGYYYGEIAVFQLYSFAFLFLVLALIQFLRFLSPQLETRYIELPVVIIYSVVTNLNFFKRMKKVAVVLISLLAITLTFLLAAFVQDELVRILY